MLNDVGALPCAPVGHRWWRLRVPPVALRGHGRRQQLSFLVPAGRLRAGGHVRRRHGNQPAAGRSDRRRLRGPRSRGMQRTTGGHPARGGRPGPPVLLRGRVRRGRDGHLRGVRSRAGRVRAGPPGGRVEPGRSPAGPPGGRRFRHSRSAPVGGGQHRAGDQVPDAGPDPVRRSARRLPGTGGRTHRGRRRSHHHRDGLRPAAGQGGHQRSPTGHEGGRTTSCPYRPR